MRSIRRTLIDRRLKSSLRGPGILSGILPYVMNIEQPIARALPINRGLAWSLRGLLRLTEFAVVVTVAFSLLGRSAVDASGATWMAINYTVNGWGWDIVGWEVAYRSARSSWVLFRRK